MSETVIIAIIGVAGTLIGSIIGLFGNSILERRRVKNDGRIHITKAQFDLQLEIYKKLSKAFFHVLVVMNTFCANCSKNSDQKLPNETLSPEDYKRLIEATCNAQDLLYENAAFLPESIYKKYDELNNIINNQFWEYLKSPYGNEDKKASEENYKAITDLIEFQLRDINADIRNHLASLSIV